MDFHFNLLDEPWVPCVFPDGSMRELNLTDTIRRAHEIREVHGDVPPVTIGIMSLLLSIAYHVFPCGDADEWEARWQQGQFDESAWAAYTNRWHDRFDLFDPLHPFYQDPLIGLREKDKKALQGKEAEPKPVNGVILHSSFGDAASLFDHTTELNPPAYTFAEAARILLMAQATSLGGMTSASISSDKYYADSPLSRGIFLMSQGNTLFETICLNLASEDFDYLPQRDGNREDLPIWEKDDVYDEWRTVPAGMAELLTWFSRRVKLVPELKDGNPVVKQLFFAPGQKLADAFEHPYYCYAIRETANGTPEKPKSIKVSANRALWRDSARLLSTGKKISHTALPVNWLSSVVKDVLGEENLFQLRSIGICTEPGKKKAYFYREEVFSYPAAYFGNEELVEGLTNGLNNADEVRKQLWGTVTQLFETFLSLQNDLEGAKKPDKKDVENLYTHSGYEPFFWAGLNQPYNALLNGLPVDEDLAKQTWNNDLRSRANGALDHAILYLGNSIPAYKATAIAKRRLYAGLNKVLGTNEEV